MSAIDYSELKTIKTFDFATEPTSSGEMVLAFSADGQGYELPISIKTLKDMLWWAEQHKPQLTASNETKIISHDPYEIVKRFIEKNGYTYQVQHVVDAYKEKYGKVYVSHTMKHCCESLRAELDVLVAQGY
ncbi:hypothetical protein ABD87_22605 [Lysinibacillus sphaericus]|uniref:hypothetical protein n=1 Tax=Lysinibacillus sphaericus TaxID=1421 RepID=UPI0018CF593F|nr:hypothetical protein [Lysinibacillus sphaericus]MBG9732218.1 hypothetical protein [Lysinibacillus sphaericus]